MYSSITEAWSHDPVKEMTDKLSNGSFILNSEENGDYNSKKNMQNMQNMRNNRNQEKMLLDKYNNSLNISDINSISLMSDNMLVPARNSIDYGPFAPAKFDKFSKKNNYNRRPNYNINIDSDTENSVSDYFYDKSSRHSHHKCNYSVRHLKNCDRCYEKLKQLINDKVDKRFDEMMLDYKLKQIQNVSSNQILQTSHHTQPQQAVQPIQPFQPFQQIQTNTNSWKETLIIVIGVLIALFIMFLIIKALNK